MNAPAIPRGRTTAGVAATTGAANSLGVAFLALFLFLAYSRLADLFLPNVRIPLIVSLAALLMTVMTGGVPRALLSGAGIGLMAFSTWLVLAVPSSYWPGGSVQLLTDQWIKSFLVFVIVAGLLRTSRHCQLAMNSIGLAVLTITGMGFLFGTTMGGSRLVLEQGVLANPNDLAQLLLLGLPCLLLMRLNTESAVWRGGISVVFLGVLVLVARTGSRGGAVTIGVVLLVVLLRTSWRNRAKMAGALLVAGCVVLSQTSEEQWIRYSTILSGTDRSTEAAIATTNQSDDAVGSTEARLELLKQSIALTFDHPVFGIGPGIFQAASAEYSARQGDRGIWHDTHNTYTQVSSEAGLPALAFFVGVLIISLKNSWAVYIAAKDQGDVRVSNTAYCLWLCLLVYAVSISFASVGYHPYLPTFAGLAVALRLAAQSELRPSHAATAVAPKGPSMPHQITPARVRSSSAVR